MRIGIISNTDSFIPFTHTLAAQNLQVYVFFSPSPDQFVNQKVAAFIQQINISFTEEKNVTQDLYQWLKKGNYDVCFMLGYAKLIKLDRLKTCATKFFNIHFGPLPGFRGPVPVFWQLKNGMDKVGLAIHQLSEKFDDGPVIWTKRVPNLSHYNYQSVNDILSQLCVEGVFYIMNLLMHGLPLPYINNAGMVMAYYKKPGLNEILINWEKMDAIEICNLIRACNPWNKGALTFFKGIEVKLMDAVIIDEEVTEDYFAGSIIADENSLHVYCRDAKVLNINMLFFNYAFLATYFAKTMGIVAGEKFGDQ